jgi:hypothetical protein
MEVDPVAVELKRLVHGGYVGDQLRSNPGASAGSAELDRPMLYEPGARAVGLWPSDDPYEALLALIERQLAEEGDTETKTKLRKLRETLAEVGKGTASGLLVALIQAGAHLH